METPGKKRVDDFIDECIKEFLFEQEEENALDTMSKFLDAEEKKTKTSIDADNRIKGAQIDPLERAIKEKQIRINRDKLAQLQKLRDTVQKSMVAQKQAQEKEKKVAAKASVGVEVTESEGTHSAPVLTRQFAEQAPVIAQQQPKRKKVKRVMFEKSTGNPFYVDFSERGFLVGGTRLSFEALETALSKNYNIVLDGGKGMALDQVRMQKILKYKDAV